jgi:hypothetical protein
MWSNGRCSRPSRQPGHFMSGHHRWRQLLCCRTKPDSAFCDLDGSWVEGRLPSRGPRVPCFLGRVQRSGGQVETFQRGLLMGKVAADSASPPVAGVQRLDRIGRADDLCGVRRPSRGTARRRPGVVLLVIAGMVCPLLGDLLAPAQASAAV